ncbi:hypothetical protein GQ53DRAFT_794665 [Thozetella sp. PMI_491]|nr:hypothetical protein GQ53DRAFT_794665 [Thozetella sp. PMI_491]
MATPTTLYVVTSFIWDDDDKKEGVQEPEVYLTKSAANAAAKKLMNRYADLLNPFGDRDEYDFLHNLDDEGLYRGTLEGGAGGHRAVEMCVYKVNLNQRSTRKTAKRPLDGPGNWPDNIKEEEDEDGDDKDEEAEEDDENDEPERPQAKKKAPSKSSVATKGKKSGAGVKTAVNPATYRKTIPAGIPNCLKGVKILFTGTFETMDRVTSLATAKKYGAEVVTKLEDTDYIVVGLRAGPKKLQVINELELETISEEEFFDILEHGVSKDKRARMANKRKADDEEEPEESQEKPRKTAASGPRKKARK